MIAVFLCVLPSGLSLRVEDQRGAAERVGRLYFLGLDSWCPGVLAVRFISDWLCLLLSHWAGTGRRVRMVVMAPFARFVWLSPGASSDSARGESPLGRNEARARTSVQLMERRGPPRRCNAGGKAGGSPGESWFHAIPCFGKPSTETIRQASIPGGDRGRDSRQVLGSPGVFV